MSKGAPSMHRRWSPRVLPVVADITLRYVTLLRRAATLENRRSPAGGFTAIANGSAAVELGQTALGFATQYNLPPGDLRLSPHMPTRRSTSPARHSLKEEQRTQGLSQILELEKDQLRGVPIPTLLARAARLYARNGAAAREAPKETFELSHAVGRLDFS